MKKKILAIAIGLLAAGGGVYFGHPHNYKDTMITEPTCTTEGTMQYTCWCGNNYTEQLKALGHTYKDEITLEATCTENGVNTYTCTACEDTYTEELEVLGHDLSTETQEATCEEDGYEKSLCSRCDYVEEEIFEALGHDYQLTEENKTEKVYVCNNCKDTYTEKIKSKPQQPAQNNSNSGSGGGYTQEQTNALIQKMLEAGCTTGGDPTGNTEIADFDRETSVDLSGVTLH